MGGCLACYTSTPEKVSDICYSSKHRIIVIMIVRVVAIMRIFLFGASEVGSEIMMMMTMKTMIMMVRLIMMDS